MNQLGPLRLVLRGSYYYIHGTYEGKLIRRACGTTDLRTARVALDDLHSELESGWRSPEAGGEISWRAVAKWICQRHRTSSKERGIPFEIDAFDVYKEMQRYGFRCSVSGIALSRRVGPNVEPDPWAASLDRIENRQGYVQDNIRVVCLAANVGMNRWGYDVLLRLSRSVVRSAEQVLSDGTSRLVGSDKVIV
jgi:hypothetical protein